MKKESEQVLYVGVNYSLFPLPELNITNRMEFQRRLEEEAGIELTDVTFDRQNLVLTRKSPMPLEIRISPLSPQIGQLSIIVMQMDNRSVEYVGREASDVAGVFTSVWPNRTLKSVEASLRCLYDSNADHAFRELWEERLGQPLGQLGVLNRPVLGGGLRLVLPMGEEGNIQPHVDLKIESYLQDRRKMYVEVLAAWQGSALPDEDQRIDPDARLEYVDNFLHQEVMDLVNMRSEE